MAVVMNYMMSTDGELFLMQMHSCLTLWLVKYYSGCEFLLRLKSSVLSNVTTELYANYTESGCACVNTQGTNQSYPSAIPPECTLYLDL